MSDDAPRPDSVRFAPRALLHRHRIAVDLSPFELSVLIEQLQAWALRAAEDPEHIDLADFWFVRFMITLPIAPYTPPTSWLA
jgi:hypothetical protein